MGYADYIWSLIKPLGVYSSEGIYNAAEIAALGSGLDLCGGAALTLESESIVSTAEDYGLAAYEEILPQRPVSSNLTNLRSALTALLRIDESCFTIAALNDTIIGCGVKATVSETDTHGVVRVVFPDVRGVPDNIRRLRQVIEGIIPCHLETVYEYRYTQWAELMNYFGSWAEIEAENLTWREVEAYIRG